MARPKSILGSLPVVELNIQLPVDLEGDPQVAYHRAIELSQAYCEEKISCQVRPEDHPPYGFVMTDITGQSLEVASLPEKVWNQNPWDGSIENTRCTCASGPNESILFSLLGFSPSWNHRARPQAPRSRAQSDHTVSPNPGPSPCAAHVRARHLPVHLQAHQHRAPFTTIRTTQASNTTKAVPPSPYIRRR